MSLSKIKLTKSQIYLFSNNQREDNALPTQHNKWKKSTPKQIIKKFWNTKGKKKILGLLERKIQGPLKMKESKTGIK